MTNGAGLAVVITRRITQLVGIIALGAFGVMLVLSATGATTDAWRRDAADWFRDLARPDLATWAVALIGLGLVVLGLFLMAAQLISRGGRGRGTHLIHETPEGETRIRRRAVLRAVEHTVRRIEHVTGAEARWSGTATIDVDVHVDDGANVADLEAAVRDALGHPFWIDLGLADVGVNIVMIHAPRAPSGDPPRVR